MSVHVTHIARHHPTRVLYREFPQFHFGESIRIEKIVKMLGKRKSSACGVRSPYQSRSSAALASQIPARESLILLDTRESELFALGRAIELLSGELAVPAEGRVGLDGVLMINTPYLKRVDFVRLLNLLEGLFRFGQGVLGRPAPRAPSSLTYSESRLREENDLPFI